MSALLRQGQFTLLTYVFYAVTVYLLIIIIIIIIIMYFDQPP